jgi:hypothetical protein
MPVSISGINVELAKFIVLSQRILDLVSYFACEFVIGFGCQGKSAFAPEGSKESLQTKIQFEKRRVLLEKPTSGFSVKKDTANSKLQPLQIRQLRTFPFVATRMKNLN